MGRKMLFCGGIWGLKFWSDSENFIVNSRNWIKNYSYIFGKFFFGVEVDCKEVGVFFVLLFVLLIY